MAPGAYTSRARCTCETYRPPATTSHRQRSSWITSGVSSGSTFTDRLWLGAARRPFVALSKDGVDFTASDEVLGIFYWRVFRWDGRWYGMAKGGLLYRSNDGLTDFEQGPNPFPGSELRDEDYNNDGPRHVATHLVGDRLWVYYSSIGDAPERIFRVHIDLTPDWTAWQTSKPVEVLRPELEYEGVSLPVEASKAGAVKGSEHALRDPAIFEDTDGRIYMVYSIAGESGLAIAEVYEP